MSIRELQQLAALIISALTIIFAAVSCRTKPSKRAGHIFFIIYGLIGLVFYTIVFSGGEGHMLSPARSLIKDTMVMMWPGLWLLRDIRRIQGKKTDGQ